MQHFFSITLNDIIVHIVHDVDLLSFPNVAESVDQSNPNHALITLIYDYNVVKALVDSVICVGHMNNIGSIQLTISRRITHIEIHIKVVGVLLRVNPHISQVTGILHFITQQSTRLAKV
jgi:hypothetical protein